MNKKLSLSLILGITVIIKSLKINRIVDLSCLFVTCFIMSYSCFNDVKESIKYAIFLLIIFELLRILLSVNNTLFAEKLTNEKDEDSKNDDIVDVIDESVNESVEPNDSDTKEDGLGKELKDLEKHLVELNGKDEEYDSKKSLDNMSPAQAQRELYRLVDTTNLLKKTMTEMAPVLNEGKKIMKSMESLNMIN